MARSILANLISKLNLSHQKTAIFQRIILSGNAMAKFLHNLERKQLDQKKAEKLVLEWRDLMAKLIQALF